MRDEDLSGTIFTLNNKTDFFMRWKQGSGTICDKIYLHHRLMPCILSKSADPKLIWGYYLDRFSPDRTIVLSQQLKVRKQNFFFIILYSLGLCIVACWYLTYITIRKQSLIFHLFLSSPVTQLAWFHPSEVKVYLKHWSKQLLISTNQSQQFFLCNSIHSFSTDIYTKTIFEC